MPRPSDDHVQVGGIRYKISSAQLAAFEHQLRAVVLSGNAAMQFDEQSQADEFLVSLPVWALQDLLDAAQRIVEQVGQLVELRTS